MAMKRFLTALLASAALFAGCSADTDPATNVTADGATVWADTAWENNEKLAWWWETKGPTGGWKKANAKAGPTVLTPAGSSLLASTLVDLAPNTAFKYRLCGYREANGGHPALPTNPSDTNYLCWDKDGGLWNEEDTPADTVWDSFTTPYFYGTSQPPVGWNLYHRTSHYNTKLSDMFPGGIPVEANSAARTASTFNGSPSLTTTTNQRWSIPIYYARPSDPLYTLNVTNFGSKDYTQDLPSQIRLPQGAAQADSAAGDQAIWIENQEDGFVYHCRLGDAGSINHTTHVITSWRCFRLESDGSGFRFDDEPVPRAQPIRPEELTQTNGDIGHMLSLNVSCVSEGAVGWLSTSDSVGRNICNGNDNALLRFGDVVYLNMTDTAIANLSIPDYGKNILRGLAHYGAIVERNSGTPQADGSDWYLQFENQLDRTSVGGSNPYTGNIALPLDYSTILTNSQWKNNMKVIDPTQLPPRP